MVVKGEIKKYMGAIPTEEVAARYYDKYLIIIKGIKVRELILTHFYSPKQIFPTIETKRWSFCRQTMTFASEGQKRNAGEH